MASYIIIGVLWCLSTWLALRIARKMGEPKEDWGTKVCVFIFAPFMLFMTTMEYLRRKKRAKYNPIENINRKKDL